jgi:hypothetical protein
LEASVVRASEVCDGSQLAAPAVRSRIAIGVLPARPAQAHAPVGSDQRVEPAVRAPARRGSHGGALRGARSARGSVVHGDSAPCHGGRVADRRTDRSGVMRRDPAVVAGRRIARRIPIIGAYGGIARGTAVAAASHRAGGAATHGHDEERGSTKGSRDGVGRIHGRSPLQCRGRQHGRTLANKRERCA